MLGIFRKKKGKKENENKETLDFNFTNQSQKINDEILVFEDFDIRDIVSADGINPNPHSYMVINDKGMNCYVRSFYINAMPKRSSFATTFAPLFNYDDCTASVFINPITEGRAIQQLDKQIISIESEWTAAEKEHDRNRKRKMEIKMNKTEKWARNIESGGNKLFEVAFLFSLFAESLEDLTFKNKKFVSMGKEKGIELVSCYGMQPEAFLSNGPFNKIYHLSLDSHEVIKPLGIKMHPMDKYGLSTIFNHTSSSFTHENGIPAGRNLNTGEPILYDPYDEGHDGFNAVFSGKTGTGKSGTIKMYGSRLSHDNYQFAIVDSDRKGNRGEYSLFTERIGGVNYEIKNGSKYILNLYELAIEIEYDETTDTEFKTLHVLDKIASVSNIIMSMIRGTKNGIDFKTATYIERIVRDINTELYYDRDIYENNVNSLYTDGTIMSNGILTTGRVKKELPTISDFFIKTLIKQKIDKNQYHKEPYTLIIDSIKDYVKELIYDIDTFTVYSKETYHALRDKNPEKSEKIVTLTGTRGYFDGQSTVFFETDTPAFNIDISSLPKGDKPIAQEVALNFLSESFIKKNSQNIKKARKRVIIIDEAHKMFSFEDARKFLDDYYRTARKYYVSVWTCMQSLKDCDGYKETESIIANATSKFIFKHDPLHAKFLKENTILTDSQIDKVLSIGGDPDDENDKEHKGEVCLIDNNRVVFLKVDYLSTERYIVETNIKNVKQMAN